MSGASARALSPVAQHELTGAVTFLQPLPGLGEHTAFTLCPVEDTDDLYTLTADGVPGGRAPRLFLLDPAVYFLDYAPALPPDVIEQLSGTGENAATKLVVLAVLHPADAVSGPTANLLAPVAIHPGTRRAQQVVLEDAQWPLRAPLMPDSGPSSSPEI